MEKNNNVVNEFIESLRNAVPFYGFTSSAIELIFIKYMSNYTKITSEEDFKTILSYKNMFIEKKYNPNLVKDVFKMIEKNYNIEYGLLDTIINSLNELFKNEKDEKLIFSILNSFDLPNKQEEMANLIESIIINGEDKDVLRTAQCSTSTNLIKLVNKILDIKENDVYMNSFAGLSKSVLNVKPRYYIGYEINKEVCAISNLIMILLNKCDFEIYNQDYYLSENKKIADKVFSDGPFGLILKEQEYYILQQESKRSDYFNLKKACESLKENGIATVLCPSGVLFKTEYAKLRNEYSNSYLKAVISLPSILRNAAIPVNLVVLQNSINSDDVVMIDASSKDYCNKGDKRVMELSDEAIEKIMSSLNGEMIDNFSTIIKRDDIYKNEDISWLPAHYLDKKIDVNFRASIDIKKELNETYKQLFELLKEEN